MMKRPKTTCLTCRKRKVKCDRQRPCSSCKSSRVGHKCVYSSDDKNQTYFNNLNNQIQLSLDDEQQQIKRAKIGNTFQENNILASDRVLAFLNEKSSDYKKTMINKRTNSNGTTFSTFYGPLSMEAIFNSNKIAHQFTELSKSFILMERTATTENFPSTSKPIDILQAKYTEEKIIELVESTILPFCEAFEERLSYFEKELQDFFYESVPMKVLQEKFKKWFVLSKVHVKRSDEEPAIKILKDNGFNLGASTKERYVFHPPELSSEYAILSLITSVVRQVMIFTEHLPGQFQNDLVYNQKQFQMLTLATLSYSEYRSKPSFYSLLSLMMIRNNLFFLDMSTTIDQTENQAYLFLQIILNVALNIGIHVQCDIFVEDGIPESAVIKIWNFLQLMDAIYGIIFSKPPIINYNYCMPNIDPEMENLIGILRSVAGTFVSKIPISINDMIQKVDELSAYSRKLPNFNSLIYDHMNTEESANWDALLVWTKCFFLAVHQTILYKIRYTLEECSMTSDPAIFYMKQKCEHQLTVSLLLAFKMMKESIIASSVHQNLRYTHSFIVLRCVMAKFISFSYSFIISNFAIFDKYHFVLEDDKSYKDNIELDLLNLEYLENDVFLPFENVIPTMSKSLISKDSESQTRSLTHSFKNNFTSLMNLFTDFYNIGSKYKIITAPMVLTKELKYMMVLCHLLKTAAEFRSEWQRNNPLQMWRLDIEEWKKVIEKTRKKLLFMDANMDNDVSDPLAVNWEYDFDFIESKLDDPNNDFFLTFNL
ncbi:hypothetical protein DAMA08_040140 [Martiniozyma asiatica (nom. inval.)]|nr:hypothetical protein DAMA08_040140 [Martiniozyma asiatica]